MNADGVEPFLIRHLEPKWHPESRVDAPGQDDHVLKPRDRSRLFPTDHPVDRPIRPRIPLRLISTRIRGRRGPLSGRAAVSE